LWAKYVQVLTTCNHKLDVLRQKFTYCFKLAFLGTIWLEFLIFEFIHDYNFNSLLPLLYLHLVRQKLIGLLQIKCLTNPDFIIAVTRQPIGLTEARYLDHRPQQSGPIKLLLKLLVIYQTPLKIRAHFFFS
jgi:hypothetical protein